MGAVSTHHGLPMGSQPATFIHFLTCHGLPSQALLAVAGDSPGYKVCLALREQDGGTMELSPYEPKSMPVDNCVSFLVLHEASGECSMSLKAPLLPLAGPPRLHSFLFLTSYSSPMLPVPLIVLIY